MPSIDIQKALLSKGYFPKELPPTFTTADFGASSVEILGEWRAAKVFSTNEKVGKTALKKKRRDAYTYDVDSAEAEIITKPKLGAKEFFEESRMKICDVVKSAARAKLANVRKAPAAAAVSVSPKLTADAVLEKPAATAMIQTTEKVVAIGASTGGTEALRDVLTHLPGDLPGIAIVQHIPAMFSKNFADRKRIS